MIYCPQCGASVAGEFCENCGDRAAMPPMQTAPKKNRAPWIVFLVLVPFVCGAYYFYQDNEKKFAETRSTGFDIISMDAKTGVTVSRDRKTGKIITMDVKDLQKDEVRPAIAEVPAWAPIYPSVTSAGTGANGALLLRTTDPASKVLAFYEKALGEAGIRATRNGNSFAASGTGGSLSLTVQAQNSGSIILIAVASS
jgi:hypothetical protein